MFCSDVYVKPVTPTLCVDCVPPNAFLYTFLVKLVMVIDYSFDKFPDLATGDLTFYISKEQIYIYVYIRERERDGLKS